MHTPGKIATARDPLLTASTPRLPRRAYHRLRIHRRLLPLLAVLTLLTGLLVSAAAYVALRFGIAAVPAADVNELGLVLLLITLLMTALAVLCGALLSGAPSSASLAKLDLRLNEVAGYAADLEQLVRAQVGRSQRQGRLARQVSDYTRELNTLMEVIEQGQAALRESAGEIWAGMSQPGQALAPATAARLAQQSAVVAGRIGAATEDARDRCRHLIGLMNQVIAEGRVLGDEGKGLEERANALRQAIERVEVALGARVVDRQYGLPGNPFARRLRRASRRRNASLAAAPPPTPLTRQTPLPGASESQPASATLSGLPPGWPAEQRPAAHPCPLPPLPASPDAPSSSSSAGEPPRPPSAPPRGEPLPPPSRPPEPGTRSSSFPSRSLPGISLPGASWLPSGPAIPGLAGASGPAWPAPPPPSPSQQPPSLPPGWPSTGGTPPLPPNGPPRPGPGRETPPPGWLNA